MKKLIIGTIGSILMIFVIWLIVGWIDKGDSIVNYHLDLQATIRKMNLIFSNEKLSGFSFIELFRGFRNNLEKINSYTFTAKILQAISGNNPLNSSTGFSLLINAVSALFDPLAMIFNALIILAYIPIILITLVIYAINFIMGLVEFVFAPVFIPV